VQVCGAEAGLERRHLLAEECHRGGEIATAPSARTAAIGPDGALYLPSATMIPPLATAGPDARPTMAPGSFRLLVVRPD